MKVIGFDISTAITGLAIIEGDSRSCSIIKLDHIDFKKCKTLWQKADKVYETLMLNKETPEFQNIEKIAVEDAMLRFTPGKSSMQTISTLLRFNGLVSYMLYNIFEIEPQFISVGTARKTCGLRMQQKKNAGGLSHKEQCFKLMMERDLKDVKWPLKKNGDAVDWSRDVVDAFVIAKAGISL